MYRHGGRNNAKAGRAIATLISWMVIATLGIGAPAPWPCRAGRRPPVAVIVCDGHHRALAHWLAASRRGVLSRSGVGVIHYDAHPDMGVPDFTMPRELPADIERFMARVDIATFQLAAVRTGLVDRIFWLRPPWAEQFEDGRYEIHLGETAGGILKVDERSDYYVAENDWAPRKTLKDPSRLRFGVARFDADGIFPAFFRKPVVLDIDLDIFSTRNPGAEALRNAGLAQNEINGIVRGFSPKNLWLSTDPQQKGKEIRKLKVDIARLLSQPWHACLFSIYRLFLLGAGPLDLYRVYSAVDKLPAQIPTDTLLADFEMAIGLPEHISSEAEIDRVLEAIEELLASASFRPALVTIARSVDGGFTPPGLCARVEQRLIRLLQNSLGEIDLRYDRLLPSEP